MRYWLLFLLLPLLGNSQQLLVPAPAYITQREGIFIVPSNWNYFLASENAQFANTLRLFSQELQSMHAIQLTATTTKQEGTIEVNYKKGKSSTTPSYELDITKDGFKITVTSAEALHHATRTILQLITSNNSNQPVIPFLKIEDFPRFQYRGMHLDVGRHFFPVSFIKKYMPQNHY